MSDNPSTDFDKYIDSLHNLFKSPIQSLNHSQYRNNPKDYLQL